MSKTTAQELHTAARNLEIRNTVSSTLSSLLTDIELAHNLQTQLKSANVISKLEHELSSMKHQLEEIQAMRYEELKQSQALGDVFVSELVRTSVKLGELESFYVENEEKVVNYNDMKCKLERAEEVVRTMKMRKSLNQNWDKTESDLNTTDDAEPSLLKDDEVVQQEGTIPKETPSAAAASVTPETTTEPTAAAKNTTDQHQPAAPPNIEQEKVISFEDIDETTLLNIFAYLDAYDILSTAQVNVSLYSMVDSLFGLGGGPVGGFGEQEEDNEEEEESKTANAVVMEEDASVAAATVSSTKSSASAGATAVSKPKSTAAAPSSTASTASATSSNVTGAGGGGAAGFFSMLQPKPKQPQQQQAAVTNTAVDRAQKQQHQQQTPLNASIINSMASKLTDAELSIIINMRNELRAKEKDLERFKIEKEDLAARLDGTEEVKEFLIKKLRDVERQSKTNKEESIKITQQVSSDQEVISFLDARVQELERNASTLEDEKKIHDQSLSQYKSSTEKKISVLSDMLQFERDQMNSMEKEWKNTKKVLVKEVKHCRAQIVALQAERDSYYHTNLKLKDALLSLNGGGGNNGGGGGRQ